MADTLTTTTSRRHLLQGLTLSSLGLATLGAQTGLAASSLTTPDLSQPENLLAASIKMRGSLDERLAFVWMRGTRYTLVNGEALARQLAPDAKIYYRFNLRPAVTFRDQVWIRSDSFTRLVPRDSEQPGMFYKEAITYQASEADLARKDSAQVDALLSFAISTAWRPWMQMSGIDGHTTTDGIGGKELSMEAMPADFLRFTATHHPDVLEDPAALLEL